MKFYRDLRRISVIKEKTVLHDENDNDELQCRQQGLKTAQENGKRRSSRVMKYKNKPTLERE